MNHDEIDMTLRERMEARRHFLKMAALGAFVTAIGGCSYGVASPKKTAAARAQKIADGRPRLPPGQSVIERLRPMGGSEGNPDPAAWSLRVHGLVGHPFELSFKELLEMDVVEQTCDVHCVTTWSVLDAKFLGVRMADLARRAGVLRGAKHVIFEAAHGYTTNVPIDEALLDENLVTWQLDGEPLARANGSPVRGLIPHLYFWKSAKWLTGMRFVAVDEPGFWETRGYHNHADPWREERTS